jgi:hypothetical protein
MNEILNQNHRTVTMEMQFCVLGGSLELKWLYSPGTDLLWINSYVPNTNNILAIIQVHIQTICQKWHVCVHGCINM